MRTKDDLIKIQSVPLEVKILMTQRRIREWVSEFGVDGVYVSFSGGKDSTVLLHLVRKLYPDVEAVFVNTGLEFPEIQKFVKSFDNVKVLYPEMTFSEVIKKYGYPFLSKSLSHNIAIARNNPDGKIKKNVFSPEYKGLYSAYKYITLTDKSQTDLMISDKCCDVMKKAPLHKYEKETGKVGIVATMACESKVREKSWLETGCNSFDGKYKISKPMSFWTEQDVLEYIRRNNIEIASVYGEIYQDIPDQLPGQSIFEWVEEFVAKGCPLSTTGERRTGCIFCGFGAHLEKGEGRFERLKRTHPKQYDYCMNGGSYDSDGIWKPDKNGLGMKHVIDTLNSLYGEDFIKY
ncbi:MAG: phosphoadenosine phosphosulfate reductase family protein [Ruminococcus sp.]|nr:phosphoadenosine phosphosulfate reductase family protein [Ruminococcus sp.]